MLHQPLSLTLEIQNGWVEFETERRSVQVQPPVE
jgi:hypothetical protein